MLCHFSLLFHFSPQKLTRSVWLAASAAVLGFAGPMTSCSLGDELQFERVQLSDKFYSEGGTFGDFNGDGQGDVAIGPWIYWGGDFEKKSRFYEGDSVDPVGYSKNFLMYSGDANDDGHRDIYVLGFPGEESWWYENPGDESVMTDAPWKRHTMLDVVDNESPMMKDIDGDGLDDLVCSSKGHYGYASRAGQDPKQPWKFTQISPNNNYHRFTHGLGVGDVDNDGHLDLLEKDGWWKNPGKPTAEGEHWKFNPFAFSEGGSQMHAVDLDGDGKNEIITGQAAHGFGLVYYKATNAEATQFERHAIMTDDPATSPVGVAVSQLHALEIIDVNGDGVPDMVTGKRWWAHASGDPGSAMPATLLWIETQRVAGGVKFAAHVIDNSSGVGTQVSVGDVNGDGSVDVVVGIKRGAYLFLHRPTGLPQDQLLVAGLAAQDTFGQRPAEQLKKLEDAVGGFVPAIGDRALNFSFDAEPLQDWEIRGPLAATAIADKSFDSGSGKVDAIGELISRPFRLTQSWISFEVAGSGHPEARAELISEDSGLVIASTSGTGDAALTRVWFNVEEWKDQLVRFRAVDHAGDGYIRFDDLRLHSEKGDGPIKKAPVAQSIIQ